MWIRNRVFPVLALTLAGATGVAHSQDARQLVQQVVTNELTSVQADQSRWLFCEIDQTPNGRVVRWVAQTEKSDVPRIVEERGYRLSETEQLQNMEAYLRDSAAQARERKKWQEDDRQARDLLKQLPEAFVWTLTGTQGNQAMLHFKPDPKFHAPTREAKVLTGVEGDLVVDSSQQRIVSLKGRLIHEVKFGGGLLGELKAGGTFDIERREVSPGEWQITETHVHLAGRMLLFKSVSEQEDDEKSNFKLLPSDLTLEQAKDELRQRSDLAKN
jgi:hypothetical protein